MRLRPPAVSSSNAPSKCPSASASRSPSGDEPPNPAFSLMRKTARAPVDRTHGLEQLQPGELPLGVRPAEAGFRRRLSVLHGRRRRVHAPPLADSEQLAEAALRRVHVVDGDADVIQEAKVQSPRDEIRV